MGTGLYNVLTAPTDLDEVRKLDAIDSFAEDGAEFSIVGDNAVRAVYGWNRWVLFDMGDSTVVSDNTTVKEGDKSVGMISFDDFNNAAMVARARINGCKIAQEQILPYPETSEYRVEERTRLKNIAANFAAKHCPTAP